VSIAEGFASSISGISPNRNGFMKNFQIHQNAAVRVPRNAMQKNSKVMTLTVEKTVLAEAVRVANGDVGRLEIIGPNDIIVWNSREQRDAIRAIRPKKVRSPMAGRPQEL
jgi:hypothetical protein